MNAADAFRQVSSANKRAEFAIAAKAKLGLPPHDMSRFCFRCGAGNEKSSRPYHPAKDCKLPPSDNIHKCPPNIKLFHEEKFCPFGKGDFFRFSSTMTMVLVPHGDEKLKLSSGKRGKKHYLVYQLCLCHPSLQK